MKSVISLFSLVLITISSLSSLGLAQNVTINLEPINPPIQIPAPGGSFDYNATVSNTGATPQTFDAWIMVKLPDSTWYGPVLGPMNLTLQAGNSLSRLRIQAVPQNAPTGTYLYEGRIGAYPSTVWNYDNFQVVKLPNPPGGTELWVARYTNAHENGDDEPTAIAVDNHGNVYVTGWSDGGASDMDYVTIKYDASGNQLWVASYNGLGNSLDASTSLAVDGMGNVYVTGYSARNSSSPYAREYVTIKYDTYGNQLWLARYSPVENYDDFAYVLALDDSCNVYVTGTVDFGLGNFAYATIKYDSSGNQIWVAQNNDIGSWATGLAVDSRGNVYVTGYEWMSGTMYDYTTVKYNASGTLLWVARYNGPGNDEDRAFSLAVDSSGNAYVTGSSYGWGSLRDYVTVKYNTSGNQVWIAGYNGSANGDDYAISLALKGNYIYITGTSSETGSYGDYTTIKYNLAGAEQWIAHYNGSGGLGDDAHALVVNDNGEVFVTGGSWNGDNHDYSTIKYDANGNQLWEALYSGPSGGTDQAFRIALDGSGNVCVTGLSQSSYYDYATIKYSSGTIANWQPVEALVFGAGELVTEYKLQPCYPNPFNATTAISYQIPEARHVSLQIYDTAGRLVTTLVDGWREAGEHQVTFDGSGLASGVYLCRLQADKQTTSGKMLLLK